MGRWQAHQKTAETAAPSRRFFYTEFAYFLFLAFFFILPYVPPRTYALAWMVCAVCAKIGENAQKDPSQRIRGVLLFVSWATTGRFQAGNERRSTQL